MSAAGRLRVTVLGHGEMGHAMEALLGERHRVTVWEGMPMDGSEPPDARGVVSQADFVIFCLPTQPHYRLARHILPALAPHCICLSVAKGLDDEGRSAAGVFAEVFADHQPYALLYGPVIAEELRAGRYGFVQIGTADEAVFAKVRQLFWGSRLRVQHATDVTGLSWAAVLKNVYVPLFGAADELGLGDNVRGYLMAAAQTELTEILVAHGGRSETAAGLAGLGDLVTTATSGGSRHREIGRRLARGETEGITGEGVHTVATIERLRLIDPDRYPVLGLVTDLLADPSQTRRLMRDFLEAPDGRPPRSPRAAGGAASAAKG